MGQKKTPKGTVSLIKESGRVRLRWRYQKKRYSINLSHYNKANILNAKKIALLIETDIVNGNFDYTLLKYKHSSYIELAKIESLCTHFTEWVKQYLNRDCETDIDYHHIKRMLIRWNEFTVNEVVSKLNNESLSPKTYNKRLRILKGFFRWAVKSKIVEVNPLEDVNPKKVVKKSKEDRQPFTEKEIMDILEAIKKDRFSPKSSRYKHSHYYPFIYFMFKMGVRNAEAIGLRVKHINIELETVELKETLARTIKGTHSSARVRKETKNGKERILPLDNHLIEILKPLLYNKSEDDLVFTSPHGHAIDDKAFQRRVFSKVLRDLNIPHRVLYACRHTFGSRCIHEGLSPVITAFLMGNNPETALRNYTHLIELPKILPKIGKY